MGNCDLKSSPSAGTGWSPVINRHSGPVMTSRPMVTRPGPRNGAWANASPLLEDKPARESDTLPYDGSRMGTLDDKPS